MMLRGLKKMGSFETFSEIVSVPSQKINELVEKRLQPELIFHWLREYGHISVDCTIHCCCDFKGYGSRGSCLCSPQGLEKAQLYRRAPLFRAQWSVYIHRHARLLFFPAYTDLFSLLVDKSLTERIALLFDTVLFLEIFDKAQV